MLATTHELGDGSCVRLRLTRPSDVRLVTSFLAGLSPETRHRRFFSPMPVITEAVVRRFTFYDPRERIVVAATRPVDGAEQIVGLADVALLETGLAEIGLVVADAQQRKGLGSLLAEAVGQLAARYGATHLRAELVERNPPMLSLMRRLGPTVQTVEGGISVVFTRLDVRRGRRAA